MAEQHPPRVFISYSHDTVEHQERVLGLADRLRADGIDAEVDQYNAAPPEGWPLWCERQIAAADVVLMVCTEIYHRRVSGDEEQGRGLGVVWEARIIRQFLYDVGAISDKFVPVLFSDASPEQIPTPIKGWTRYVIDTEDGYEELYRRLTGQPRLLRPAVGKIRPMPTRRREWAESPRGIAPPPETETKRPLKRYLRNLVAQHHEFTFLGRARPLNLENIYVHLKVGEYTPGSLSPDGSAAPSGNESDTPIFAGQLLEIPTALSLSRRLAMLGDPGSGKTTLLKYLVMQIAQRDPRLEPFARALIPRFSVRLLERVYRFLSGIYMIPNVALLPFVTAVVVWFVQLLSYSFPYIARMEHPQILFLLLAMIIAGELTLLKFNSSITIFSGVLVLGLLAYARWWDPDLFGPVGIGCAGISIGLQLYPYWIRPLLVLLRSLLRHSTRYPVPVYLTLNNLARDPRSMEAHMVEALSDAGFADAGEYLRRKLQRGECILLLDALDEIGDSDLRIFVVSEINRLKSAYGSGNQIVVTSRIAGFQQVVLDGYLQLEVQEFEEAQIERFVRSWFADVADLEKRKHYIDGLLNALSRSPRMRLLAINPLILSLITLLYQQNWRLPERRVDLYEECLVLLIADWDRLRNVTRAARFSPEQKRKALTALAVHFHEVGTRIMGRDKLLSRLHEVLAAFGSKDALPTEFLDEIMAHTGVLRQKSRSSYDFLHFTFQEFLTACAYHEGGHIEKLLGYSGEAWWREVIRLYAALESDASSFLERLAKKELFLAAECLVDCRAVDTSAFRRVAEEIVAELKRFVREDPDRRQAAVDALAEIGEWGATAFLSNCVTEGKERPEIAVAALLALARVNATVLDTFLAELGPLLRLLHGQLPSSAPALRPRFLSLLERIGHPLVFVPAGEFLMGKDKHRVTLSEYWIDKYPVTNAQYARFVQETGLLELRGTFTTGKERHPVVKVNWEDAYAYAKWCGKQLPTEAQWEKAARGTDGRIFPWGNEWDGTRCNCSGRDTTPVENYPQGISPYGCHDMVGNVAEWVAVGYDSSGSGFNPQRPLSGNPHVLRGGSWYRSTGRTTLRPNSVDRPQWPPPPSVNWRGRQHYIGFRVALCRLGGRESGTARLGSGWSPPVRDPAGERGC